MNYQMASIFDDGPPPKVLEIEEPSRNKRRNTDLSLTPADIAKGQRKLVEMVEDAFDTLQKATKQADWSTAIKAAQIILDRSGFGPKSTVDVNTTHLDLSALSREELAERAQRIVSKLKDQGRKELPVIETTGTIQ